METRPKMKWEIRVLEDAVRRVHGDSYADEIHDPLNSFAWKSDIAYFHACESERIIKEVLASTDGIRKEDPDYVAVTKAILFAASPDRTDKHILAAQFMAEAHIIASAQAFHSLCDILAIIVYWTFRLDSIPNSPSEKRINLHSVNKVLSKFSKYSSTHNLIDNTISSSEFEYLDAYTNTTKHKSLIHSTLSASFKAEKKNGMRIKEFSYKDFQGNIKNFNHKWSHDFLFIDNQTFRVNLIKVGNSLNDYLK